MLPEKLRKKIRKRLLKSLGGKKSLQGVFERIHEFSLAAMHCGGGDNISTSGECNVVKLLAKYTGPADRPVVFDVGANIGEYSDLVLGAFGGRADIYCFEPLKKSFGILSERMTGHTNVRVFNFGFGEKAGTAPIYSDGESSKLASTLTRKTDHLGMAITHTEEARICRLDQFCDERAIGRIDLLKIDVEGAEFGVLKGAGALLDPARIGMVQFEFGPFNVASRTFFQDFFSLLDPGYRIFRILKDGFRAIDGYSESREIFLTTNYLAVSRASTIIGVDELCIQNYP